MSSGGWNSKGKVEADGLRKLTTCFLRQNGYFEGFRRGRVVWTNGWGDKNSVSIEVSVSESGGYLRIFYTQTDLRTDEKRDFDYRVPLFSTPCRYGGERYWFTCPLSVNSRPCGRKVSVLYKGGDYFGCRHCFNLTYASRNESGLYKGMVSSADLERQHQKVKRYFYNGKPTRHCRRLREMERRFEVGLAAITSRLSERFNLRSRGIL